MKILFVRHAKAFDKFEWNESDFIRPLTQEGEQRAKKAFDNFAKIYPKIDVIITSNATRARQTAEILSKSFGGVKIIGSDFLNPGSSYDDFVSALKNYYDEEKIIAVTGHEPDFSFILSEIISQSGDANIEVKKASIIEVECNENFKGVLSFLLPPKILTKC